MNRAAQSESITLGELSKCRSRLPVLFPPAKIPGTSSEFADKIHLDSFYFLGNKMKKTWSDSGNLCSYVFYVGRQLKWANIFMSL